MKFDPQTKTVTLSLEEALLLKRAAWDGPEPSPEEMPIFERLLQNIESVADPEGCQHVDAYGSLFEKEMVTRYVNGQMTSKFDSRCRLCGVREPPPPTDKSKYCGCGHAWDLHDEEGCKPPGWDQYSSMFCGCSAKPPRTRAKRKT